ncbi:hypothetical protein LCGC14_2451930, partial [marine sediment metagenome]
AGRLREALAHYGRLASRKDDLGRLASAGAVRVKRVGPTK